MDKDITTLCKGVQRFNDPDRLGWWNCHYIVNVGQGFKVNIPYGKNGSHIKFAKNLAEFPTLKDKLHRRNMQIKDLKEKLKEIITHLQNETPLDGSYIMGIQRKFDINR